MALRLSGIFACLLSLFLLVSCSKETEPGASARKELLVSAAVSMKGALTDIKKEYEKQNNDVEILFNFGSSGGLAQQIIQGAPADIYISAAREPFDRLVEKGHIDRNHSKDLIGNELVLVQPEDSKAEINSFQDLKQKKISKIAIGMPETVPAGMYAKEVLDKLGIWDSLKQEGKLIQAKDASQVLSYVETGNVDAGIVYKTDAAHSRKVIVRATADQDLHSPIVYPAGIVEGTKNEKEAEEFFMFLLTKKAQGIFRESGFLQLPGS